MTCVMESGPWNLGHLKPPSPGMKVAAKRDARQSAGKWTGDASVEPVAGRGGVEIARQGSAGTRRLYPTRASFTQRGTGIPRPASANYLGARVNVRPPLRLQLRKVFDRSCVVPEEVHAADAVVLVDVEIHFADHIVNGDVVGESIRDIGALSLIRGETSSVARNRPTVPRPCTRRYSSWRG